MTGNKIKWSATSIKQFNDGRYSMRAYRKVYDEGVLEGFVTETGLDFIVNLNFDRFKDVFIKKKHEKSDTTKTK